MKGLGKAVRELRETVGRDRAQLARAAEISVAFLIKIEQGKRGTSPATLARLASALGVGAQELVTRAALFEASSATTPQEMRQATLKAAAASPAMAVGLGWLALGPVGLPGGIIGAATAALHHASRRPSTTGSPEVLAAPRITPSEAREFLIAKIKAMPDEQAVMITQSLFSQTQQT